MSKAIGRITEAAEEVLEKERRLGEIISEIEGISGESLDVEKFNRVKEGVLKPEEVEKLAKGVEELSKSLYHLHFETDTEFNRDPLVKEFEDVHLASHLLTSQIYDMDVGKVRYKPWIAKGFEDREYWIGSCKEKLDGFVKCDKIKVGGFEYLEELVGEKLWGSKLKEVNVVTAADIVRNAAHQVALKALKKSSKLTENLTEFGVCLIHEDVPPDLREFLMQECMTLNEKVERNKDVYKSVNEVEVFAKDGRIDVKMGAAYPGHRLVISMEDEKCRISYYDGYSPRRGIVEEFASRKCKCTNFHGRIECECSDPKGAIREVFKVIPYAPDMDLYDIGYSKDVIEMIDRGEPYRKIIERGR